MTDTSISTADVEETMKNISPVIKDGASDGVGEGVAEGMGDVVVVERISEIVPSWRSEEDVGKRRVVRISL